MLDLEELEESKIMQANSLPYFKHSNFPIFKLSFLLFFLYYSANILLETDFCRGSHLKLVLFARKIKVIRKVCSNLEMKIWDSSCRSMLYWFWQKKSKYRAVLFGGSKNIKGRQEPNSLDVGQKDSIKKWLVPRHIAPAVYLLKCSSQTSIYDSYFFCNW